MPGRDEYNPEDTGPVGGRRRDLPAVPPARPRTPPPATPQPTYHPTTELDLGRGFPPPVTHETSEIDLSGGWPEHLKVPPRRPSTRRPGRVLGVDVGTVRVGVAPSGPTWTGSRRSSWNTRWQRWSWESRGICRVRRARPRKMRALTLRHWPTA